MEEEIKPIDDIFHVKRIKFDNKTYYSSYKFGSERYHFRGVQEGYIDDEGRVIVKPFLLYNEHKGNSTIVIDRLLDI